MGDNKTLNAQDLQKSFERSCLEAYHRGWACINQSQMKDWFENFFKNYDVKVKFEIKKGVAKKVCLNKIEGSCPLHNLHCKYPECEDG